MRWRLPLLLVFVFTLLVGCPGNRAQLSNSIFLVFGGNVHSKKKSDYFVRTFKKNITSSDLFIDQRVPINLENSKESIVSQVIPVRGHSIGILGINLSKNYLEDPDPFHEKVQSKIKNLSSQTEIRILLINFETAPTIKEKLFSKKERFSQFAIEQGADMVLWFGKEKIGPISFYQGKPIFYGLGNLVQPNLSSPGSQSFLVKIQFRDRKIQKIALLPLQRFGETFFPIKKGFTDFVTGGGTINTKTLSELFKIPYQNKPSPGINRWSAERIKIFIIGFTLAILILLVIRGYPQGKTTKRVLVTGLCLLAGFSITIHFLTVFKTEQNGHRPHYWDIYHWIIGSKYYSELGPKNLYDATLIADREGTYEFKDIQMIRDPLTKGEYSTQKVFEDQNLKKIKSPFSPERWDEFSKDVYYFKRKLKNNRWRQLFLDKGYNGSPFSSRVYGIFSNLLPVNDWGIFIMTRLDLLLMFGAFVGIFWAFGPNAVLLSIIFLMTQPVVRARYLGGVFLQYDWLAALVLAACFAKRRRWAISGPLLVYASLMKVFPVVFFVGPFLKGVAEGWKGKKVPVWAKRFFISSAVAFILLFSFSFTGHHALERWGEFKQNMLSHHGSVSSMRTGINYVLSHNPNQKTGRHSHGYADQKRLKDLSWLKYGILLLVGGLYIYLCTRESMVPWQALILSGILVYFFIVAIVYYYVFLLLFVLFYGSELDKKDSLLVLILFFLGSLLSFIPYQYGIGDLYLRNIIFTFSLLLSFLTVLGSFFYRSRRLLARV